MWRYWPVLLLVPFLTSCHLFQPAQPPEPPYTRLDISAAPAAVMDWAMNSRPMFIAHAKEWDGRRYIMASYGEKPHSGFAVFIEDVDLAGEEIVVTINFASSDGETVPQSPHYPTDMVYITDLDRPLSYRAVGAEEYVPQLRGIEEIPPILAQSDFIKVFSPGPESKVGNRVTVRGVANVFEGTVNYRLRDGENQVVAEDWVTAGMGDWYYFEEEIDVLQAAGNRFALDLFTYSAKDNSEEHSVSIPLLRAEEGE